MKREFTSDREGKLAKTIEQQTSKIPSDMYLWAAIGSMAVSAALELKGDHKRSMFIGQWAPSLLILGVYNKLVKQMGSDKFDES